VRRPNTLEERVLTKTMFSRKEPLKMNVFQHGAWKRTHLEEDVEEDIYLDGANDIDIDDPSGGETLEDVNKPWNFPHTNAKDAMMDIDEKLLRRLNELDKITLYANAKVSFMGALLLILTICKSHAMSNASVNKLMQALSSNFLPS
jgi:hypothetical protein